jgi:ubiquinone/menaquinone biosynthesis C-methylase UbiE
VTVVDVGGRELAAALQQAGADGDVIVIDDDVDELERIRKGCDATNVSFLIGSSSVLPLPDQSVDSILGTVDDTELARVLRTP